MDAGPGDRSITVVSGLPRSGTSLMMQMLEAAGLPIASDGRRVADEDNPRGYYELEAVKRLREDASFVAGLAGQAVKVVAPLLPALPTGLDLRVVFVERDLAEVLASQARMLAHRGGGPGRGASGGAPGEAMGARGVETPPGEEMGARRVETPPGEAMGARRVETPPGEAMGARRVEAAPDEAALARAFEASLARVRTWLAERPETATLVVRHERLLAQPGETARELVRFLRTSGAFAAGSIDDVELARRARAMAAVVDPSLHRVRRR